MAYRLGLYASLVKAHMPFYFSHASRMKLSARQIVSENLKNLMESDEKNKISQAELKRRSGVDQRYIGRILAREYSVSVDILDKLARAFDLQAWQLLVPGLDPTNPPINHITESEKRLYERLKEAARMVMEDQSPPYKD